MGVHADQTASSMGITREAQDAFMLESYRRARADEAACAVEELVGIESLGLGADEGVGQLNEAKALKLRACFVRDASGSITPANASSVADGGAALVLTRRSTAAALGVTPLAVVVAHADAATTPSAFVEAPAAAVRRCLERARASLDDVAALEINEAFAAAPLIVGARLGIDATATSVNRFGGAVARGHPLGVSGARILMALIRSLRAAAADGDARRLGVAAVCNGGGGATAVALRLE